ncbi:hypothetical protein [Verrucomicrobium spinosum]|uniref:hypothetical protein n=1 Tax=Verrucomicrobium spinosum TaxID=2736 RepID=UPI00017452E5|nr:hypothetical protein [Verrucomicrobium spinosum]
MAYLLLILMLALKGFGLSPLHALMFWLAGVVIIHAIEETGGALWVHFGEISGNSFVAGLRPLHGFLFLVAPALGLQLGAIWLGFGHGIEEVKPYFIGLLIGAQLGDATFSHLIPTAQGYKRNPGLPSAVMYLLNGLLVLVFFHVPLMASPGLAIYGALTGACFFAAVLPSLFWLSKDR